MRLEYLLFIFLIVSCGYPDIDSVPNFENTKLTKEESIDLCKLSNTDSTELDICLKEINNK